MLIKINNNRFLACLLLCSLLMAGYSNYGIFHSQTNGSDISSLNTKFCHASMSDSSFAGRDSMESARNYSKLCFAASEQSRGLFIKSAFSFLVLIPATYAACQLYIRLSCEIYTQFNSNQVVSFLHKKDGMK